MKQSIKPSSIQKVAGILLVIALCVQLASLLLNNVFRDNGFSFAMTFLYSNLTYTIIFFMGLSILAFLTKEKPVRFALIVGMIINIIDLAAGYYVCTKIEIARGEVTNDIYNLDIFHVIINTFVWVWLFSVILRGKSLSRMGWIQMLPIILIINLGLYVFGLVDSNIDYPGKDFMTENSFFANFVYRFWISYIMPFFRMIGFYFFATSELFNKQYSTESTNVGWKSYSPFNKWMVAALIAPIIIIPLTILVYNL